VISNLLISNVSYHPFLKQVMKTLKKVIPPKTFLYLLTRQLMFIRLIWNLIKNYWQKTLQKHIKFVIATKQIILMGSSGTLLTCNLSIWNRVDVIAKRDAFITTIKDHKEKFSSNVKCRLINLSKSELGKVSEVILDNINNRPGKSVQCSSDPEFAFFKCSSIILVVKLLSKQNNLQILLTGCEEHFAISK
jgi:hypothetical protein